MHLIILKLPFQTVICPVTPPAFFKLQHPPDTVRKLRKSTIQSKKKKKAFFCESASCLPHMKSPNFWGSCPLLLLFLSDPAPTQPSSHSPHGSHSGWRLPPSAPGPFSQGCSTAMLTSYLGSVGFSTCHFLWKRGFKLSIWVFKRKTFSEQTA